MLTMIIYMTQMCIRDRRGTVYSFTMQELRQPAGRLCQRGLAEACYASIISTIEIQLSLSAVYKRQTMDYPTFAKQAIENSVKLIKELVGQI